MGVHLLPGQEPASHSLTQHLFISLAGGSCNKPLSTLPFSYVFMKVPFEIRSIINSVRSSCLPALIRLPLTDLIGLPAAPRNSTFNQAPSGLKPVVGRFGHLPAELFGVWFVPWAPHWVLGNEYIGGTTQRGLFASQIAAIQLLRLTNLSATSPQSLWSQKVPSRLWYSRVLASNETSWRAPLEGGGARVGNHTASTW